ncbi:MAG: hypothetical protein QOE92_1566 [Chloroflexota bacterium]|jgi:hypothetical protein|nr:hypothetical protein [Chloroflexota bacterium]
MATQSQPAPATVDVDSNEIEAVVRRLAAIHRPSASEGEREAAEWIAGTLRDLGCEVAIEEEDSTGGYWWSVGTMSALGAIAGLLSLRSQRRRRRQGRGGFGLGRLVGLAGGALVTAGLADDVTAGPHWFRHLFIPYRGTWNVVAETGDRNAARTLVVLAHHDAAHSGLVFHPGIGKTLAERFPDRVEKANTSLPFWFPVVAAPALVSIGSLLGHGIGRLVTRLGVLLGLGATALVADIGMRDTVPGANDNLSAVAVEVHLARALRENPVKDLRVLLVSCGAEETLQEGVMGFARRHFARLPVDHTWFLTLDTVGSPRLILVEAEGTLQMREYSAPFKDLIADCAAATEVPLIRGSRARSSTDACIPNRYGYPTALIASYDQYKRLSNYHWPTDTADNLDYGTVAACARLTEAVVRRMAAEATPPG